MSRLLSFAAILTFLFLPTLVLGATAEYKLLQELPGVPATVGLDSSAYIEGIFKLIIGLAGVLAVVMLVIAGIEYVGGAANPSVRSDAKERITGALIGLLLALGSWMLLNSINDQLIVKDINLDAIDPNPATGPAGAGAGSHCIIIQKIGFDYKREKKCGATIQQCNDVAAKYGKDGLYDVVIAGCLPAGSPLLDDDQEHCKLLKDINNVPTQEVCGFSGNDACSADARLDLIGCYEKKQKPAFRFGITIDLPDPQDDIVKTYNKLPALTCWTWQTASEKNPLHTVDQVCTHNGFIDRNAMYDG